LTEAIRIAVLNFVHETVTFLPNDPTLDDFVHDGCPWRPCVTLFTEELPWLKGRDLELVMGRAVCDWLGWRR
jgi:hypothetical protein